MHSLSTHATAKYHMLQRAWATHRYDAIVVCVRDAHKLHDLLLRQQIPQLMHGRAQLRHTDVTIAVLVKELEGARQDLLLMALVRIQRVPEISETMFWSRYHVAQVACRPPLANLGYSVGGQHPEQWTCHK